MSPGTPAKPGNIPPTSLVLWSMSKTKYTDEDIDYAKTICAISASNEDLREAYAAVDGHLTEFDSGDDMPGLELAYAAWTHAYAAWARSTHARKHRPENVDAEAHALLESGWLPAEDV